MRPEVHQSLIEVSAMPLRVPTARLKASYTSSLVCQPVPQLKTQMRVQWSCYFSHPSAAPFWVTVSCEKLTKHLAGGRNGYWPLLSGLMRNRRCFFRLKRICPFGAKKRNDHESRLWLARTVRSCLETSREKMQPRIRAAKTAIEARLQELQLGHGGTAEERQAVSDAHARLNLLRRNRYPLSRHRFEQGLNAVTNPPTGWGEPPTNQISFWRWCSLGDPRKHEMQTLCRAATRNFSSFHQRNCQRVSQKS
jgi:hypothetical protein